MSIEVASCTDRGLVREVNEDSVATLPEFGLVILADGMGGYNAGDVASQLAVETIATRLMQFYQSPGSDVSTVPAVEAANDAIFESVEQQPKLEGMATTVVLGIFHDGRVRYGHVGDSRIYRFRHGRLVRLTKDHSLAQELVDQGIFSSVDEALAAGVRNNILTRGLGVEPEVEIDEGSELVESGDLYLFCSDGLSNMIPDRQIEQVLRESEGNLPDATGRLLKLALENGGLDNVSAVLVRPVNERR